MKRRAGCKCVLVNAKSNFNKLTNVMNSLVIIVVDQGICGWIDLNGLCLSKSTSLFLFSHVFLAVANCKTTML